MESEGMLNGHSAQSAEEEAEELLTRISLNCEFIRQMKSIAWDIGYAVIKLSMNITVPFFKIRDRIDTARDKKKKKNTGRGLFPTPTGLQVFVNINDIHDGVLTIPEIDDNKERRMRQSLQEYGLSRFYDRLNLAWKKERMWTNYQFQFLCTFYLIESGKTLDCFKTCMETLLGSYDPEGDLELVHMLHLCMRDRVLKRYRATNRLDFKAEIDIDDK